MSDRNRPHETVINNTDTFLSLTSQVQRIYLCFAWKPTVQSLLVLKSHYAFEYTHYNSSKLQETKSPNSSLISSYNHTFTFMYFFPEMVVVPQNLEQLKKETITNQAHVCWHPRNLCFDFLNNARELLLRQALGGLKESLSAVWGADVNNQCFDFIFESAHTLWIHQRFGKEVHH